MGKWTSEEHLHFYTFIIYNYDYIFSKKMKSIDQGRLEDLNSASVEGTKLDALKIKKRKKRRGKQLSGEFYTQMELFFEDELPEREKRTRSQLRCKMNKIFPKMVEETQMRKKERWENGTIYFSDLVKAKVGDPGNLHSSGYEERVHIPFKNECKIIEEQIQRLFGISFRVDKIQLLDNKNLNRVSWRDFHVAYYPQFCKFLREMTRQKEIFRRDKQFLTVKDQNLMVLKKEQFKKWIGLMRTVVRKTERGLLYLSAEYHLLKTNQKIINKFSEESEKSLQKISLSRSKTKSSSKSKTSNGSSIPKQTLLKKRKKISRFSTSLPSNSNASRKSQKTEVKPGFQKSKVKKIKKKIQKFFPIHQKKIEKAIDVDEIEEIDEIDFPKISEVVEVPKRKVFGQMSKERNTSFQMILNNPGKVVRLEYENEDDMIPSFAIEKFEKDKKKLMNIKIRSLERGFEVPKGVRLSNFRRNNDE